MTWQVDFDDDFAREFEALNADVQDALFVAMKVLRDVGPRLGRPHVDTLEDSAHANMKELRFAAADGVWRVAFAFDPRRRALLLVAGDKAGIAERRFYTRLIAEADHRYARHLAQLAATRNRRS